METQTVDAAAQVDHVAYVRQRLADVPAAGLTKIAADAQVSMRTLYNLRDPKIQVNPTYHNVMSLYQLLRAAEQQAPAAGGK